MDQRLKFLNALVSFESAARHQSYSKAAEELFVSQAAISQQMRQLEQGLKVKLFIRSNRSMLLTESGEKLQKSCKLGFNEIINGLNAVQQEQVEGDLTITSTQAYCSLWLMPRLYKFSLAHPEINVRIMGSNQVEDLQKKHIDVAIRFGFSAENISPDNYTVLPFGSVGAYPVCSPQLVNDGCLTRPEDLLNCRLIYLTRESKVTWRSWFEHLGIKGYETHTKKTEVTSSDMALSAVLAGHGVTLAATGLFSQFLATKQLVVPFDVRHPIEWQRYLIYDENSAKASRIKIFVDWMLDEIANEVEI